MSVGVVDRPVVRISFPSHDDWLSAEELAGLSAGVLRERMVALAPEVASRARETELARRPLDDVWQRFRESGVFYHFVPKRFGGLQLGFEDLVDITLPISEACCSTGWVLTFCIEHMYIFSQFPIEAQEEMYREHPYIVAPGVAGPPGVATPVEGGYRVSGRWKFASGIMNADWIMAMAMVAGTGGTDGPPEMRFVVFPSTEATVYDVWHMSGMCGTGSNDFSVQDVFVPQRRAMPGRWFFECNGDSKLLGNRMYQVPIVPFTSLTTLLPALGGARAAVDIYRRRLQERVVLGTEQPMMEEPARQVRLADAQMLVHEAEVLVRDACRSMTARAHGGEDLLDTVWRRRLRAQNQRAMSLCTRAVDLAVTGAGAGAQALSDPLQRIQRDVNTMQAHALYDYEMAYEQHGRALLGLEPNHMMV